MEGLYLPRISEGLYVGMCGIIGTPTEVKARHDVVDTREMIHNQIELLWDTKMTTMLSGSFREGFRLKTSDMDMMVWFIFDKVICDFTQIPLHQLSQHLILLECHDTPPGFAKLKLLTPPSTQLIRQSCEEIKLINSNFKHSMAHVLVDLVMELNMTYEELLNRRIYPELADTCLIIEDYMSKLKLDKLRQMENIVDHWLRRSIFSQFQIAHLQILRSRLLIHITFLLDKSRECITDNRCLDMLISATELGFICDPLYVALYLYNKQKYMDALHYVESTKQNLSKFSVHHITHLIISRYRYRDSVQGQSFPYKFRMTTMHPITMHSSCFVNELRLEMYDSQEINCGFIPVHALMMMHMLSFLCHHHLGNRLRSRQSIENLQTTFQYERRVTETFRDISWHMLGICKQIFGDTAGALYCYQESLKHLSGKYICNASYIRIQNIISETKDLNNM